MLERLSLDFVTQQQQHTRSGRDSISIHIAGRVVKRDDDLMTILTHVSMGYGIGVMPQTMTRMNIPERRLP
jgi:DNA-binding transcriptional LysR family regulator